jgi:hypothetical protein
LRFVKCFIFLLLSRTFVKSIIFGVRTLQPVEKVPVCHPEPGPEPCPETSNVILNLFQDQDLKTSGSNDFRVSNTLISSDAEMNSA